MKHFKFYSKGDVLSITRVRKFETKLGERVTVLTENGEWPNVLQNSPARFVLLGIPEDIGVKANYGEGGADTNWYPFLSAFLNMQSNDFLTGENVLLLGHFDFGDLKYLIENNAYTPSEKIDAYRHAVNAIDDEVEKIIKVISAAGKIPVVIGGGHNNAYPIIVGAAKGFSKYTNTPLAQINCINMDAHADYRPMEGRHSGNAFRYAEEDGFLGKYAVVALHEAYLSQGVLTAMQQNPFINFSTYDDVFVHEKQTFLQAIRTASGFVSDNVTGIELDMDSIEKTLCSATTPSGVTSLQARQFLSFAAANTRVAYLHICEGATQSADGIKDETVGKLIAYLVTDFIKAVTLHT